MLLTIKNMKIITKSEDIVICGSCEIFMYIISICEIYMFTVCTHFVQCIKTAQRLQYCMILFHVSDSNA